MIKLLSSRAESVNFKETLRYMGVNEPDEGVLRLFEECSTLILKEQKLAACYSVFDAAVDGDAVDLGFCKVVSHSLSRYLENCKRVLVFACTAGMGIDRLIQKYIRISPSRAAVLQAAGAALVESWCDELCRKFTDEYGAKRSRFSCGYGDLDISLQRDIFATLQVTKNIGVNLNDNFFMTPTKSVTAFVGIE